MYGNYYCSPYVLNFNLGLPLFNQFPCHNPQTKNQEHLFGNCRQLPQSYTTQKILVKEESDLSKRTQGLKQPPKNQQECEQLKNKPQNKSIFHNYQKHLVTTLKQKITSKQIEKYDASDDCLKQLWRCFNKSKIANRTLLLAVFGEKESHQYQVLRCLQKCQFNSITPRFTFQQIKAAQEKTRQIIKLYFKNKNLDQELAQRKLSPQEKTIFKHYISYFLSEISQGTLNKRLPKRNKQQMML